ncbi:bis(5'-nucleosyl)-tetraphosphatase (symmetrical) YqeK [Anaerosacchariphilus sp. NSJ-68]|uniref:bis(5'-nucleosyl)-tetraphosphatase (symmetrical) n=2 Tax=Lachnospiraceae TaxID=186803 RepID=A0A923LBZ2_9FIRM|nr:MULTISPECIES: bis(5'-nucleosyl)-tetraphosphatase (symmetrical) YqeK [Lachnospiraceae]MBC5659811.1 bis(5'-nucleosyl)-tetraphosphatase (symmetrical) YqeK [Anaerosacchariphilus hominis]MBC5697478.1 bis(5'-nucleosyl)-tetraphosphatase (symmetrical) YqeK [Roseburia difficilis]
MKTYDMKAFQKKLKREMDEGRYQHTLGVMYTAAALAMRYEYDIQKAQIAGLLHDCAKCIPNGKKLKLCEKYQIPVTEVENRNPFLLHAKLGSFLASHEYDVQDEEILSAILYHTTGKPDMSLLDKIVYIADYIEPRRNKAPNLTEVRKLAFLDLDAALYKILSDTLSYLDEGTGEVDEMTIKAYEYYKAHQNQADILPE